MPHGRVLCMALTLLVLAARVAAGAFAEQYTLTDIGRDFMRGGFATVTDVDPQEGTVIGSFDDSGYPHAIQLYPAARDIGPLFSNAYGIDGTSIAGFIVSVEGPADYLHHATIWENGIARELRTLDDPPRRHSAATCVNADGDIWGFADRVYFGGAALPLLWVGDLPPVILPTLAGGTGMVAACNDAGDSAGESTTRSGETHCAYWPVSGGVRDCHPGHGTDESRAVELNQNGQLVANARQYGRSFGYLWHWPYLFWLLPLPEDTESHVENINDVRDAVGQSCIGMGSERTCHAVGWENGQPLDIRARTTNATGWAFDQAVGITNDGAIVVHGHREGARWDEGRFVLLTPVENEVVAWYKWKTRIHNWYARQYWRTMRAYYRSQ